jgi:hypothetical protein
MSVIKFAVKVMLAADDWIYVTEDTHGKCWDLQPVLFDTRTEAEKYAKSWTKKGGKRFVKVEEYYVQ